MRKIRLWAVAICLAVTAPLNAMAQDAKNPMGILTAILRDGLKEKYGASLTNNPNFKFPADRERLDKALDEHDYAFLLRREAGLRQADDVFLYMNWLKYRSVTGGGFLVNKLYAAQLWRMSESYEKAGVETGSRMKRTALAQALYTFLLSVADAPQCTDPSAPNNRSQETLDHLRPMFLFGRTMTQQEKDTAIGWALQMERTMEPLRENDDALCRGGAADIAEALAAMEKTGQKPEETSIPGVPGRTVLVPITGIKAKFQEPANWLPRRDEVRKNLPDVAKAILENSEAAR